MKKLLLILLMISSFSLAQSISYKVSGETKLSANKTVNLTSSMTSANIQDSIDAQPKNLGGYTLTFQFADGTYTLTTTLYWKNFYSGTVTITGKSSDNTLSTTKAVVLNFTNDIGGISCNTISGAVNIKNLKINLTSTQNVPVVLVSNSLYTYVSAIYALASSATGVECIRVAASFSMVENCYVGLSLRGISCFWGAIRSIGNDDGGAGNQPVTGLFANSGSIYKYGTQPDGSSANEGLFGGGEIR